MGEDDRQFSRALNERFSKMRLENPDNEHYQVFEPSSDGRVKVRRAHWEGGKYITVPSQSLRMAKSYSAGAGVTIGYEQGNRQLPFLKRLGAYMGALSTQSPVELVIWAQGAGNVYQRFAINDTTPVWLPEDSDQPLLAESGEEEINAPPLGVIIINPTDPTMVWLYQAEVFEGEFSLMLQAVNIALGSVQWTLELDPANRYSLPSDRPPDLGWGWLFFDEGNETLVVIDQRAAKKAYKVSTSGTLLATLEPDYYLYQSSVYNGVVVKGWHLHRDDATVNSWPQDDSKIRGFPFDGDPWDWDPIDSAPESVTAPQVCSTGRVFNPFGGTTPFLQEGRWPIHDDRVLVFTAGWDLLEDDDTAKLIPLGRAVDSNLCVTQIDASEVIGRKVWAAISAVSIADGAPAWIGGTVWDAEEELVEDEDTQDYWSTKIGSNIDHASPIDSVFWSDEEEAYKPLTITGSAKTYMGVATHRQLNRQTTFSYQYAPTGNPADGLASATGNYENTVGTAGLPAGTLERSTTLHRPDLYYFPYSSVQLLPRSHVHLETGSLVYPKGEDLVDAGETRSDSAPHQVTVDSEGNSYVIYRRPKPYRIGGRNCLQEFDGEHIVDGAPIRDWKYWQIGEIRQSWITILEKRNSEGAVVYQQDISYYFAVTYQGLPT